MSAARIAARRRPVVIGPGSMRIALTGASGVVGRFIAHFAAMAGHEVTAFGRRPVSIGALTLPFRAWQLGEPVDLRGQDALIHAAFLHKPGRFRGGEGDDPAGFRRANIDGSLQLFREARDEGVGRAIFLSSRAVFDGHPPGTRLTETLPPAPTSLYGEAKAAVEASLADMNGRGFRTASIRATGVYGQAPAGPPHKWADLFKSFLAGEPMVPRIATEVHGIDLAAAVLLVLSALAEKEEEARTRDEPTAVPRPGQVDRWRQAISAGTRRETLQEASDARRRSAAPDLDSGNGSVTGPQVEGVADDHPPWSRLPAAIHVSDLVLDYHDLLGLVAKAACLPAPVNLPPQSPRGRVSVLSCPTLERLGWQPGGLALLERTVEALVPPAIST